MPKIEKNTSLAPFNTFGLEVKAERYAEIHSLEDLKEILESGEMPTLFLGGGSNVLLLDDIHGLVLRNCMLGKKVEERQDYILVTVASGENWHELVLWAVENGYAGIENMSLIPGTVGAAPMQNIGAYGTEIKDVFVKLRALEIASGELREFRLEECAFGYRESIFKHGLKNKFIIVDVTLKLQKTAVVNTSYGAIKDTLKEMGVEKPTIQDVSKAVIHIRKSKLPDPAEIGNSGSFFKNPEIPKKDYEAIKLKYPEVPSYPVSDELVKVPAGWLIEKAGWKGYTEGSIGVHAKQALVLVNYGGGKGRDIAALAIRIQEDIHQKFGISLSPEVNFVH